MNAVALPRNKRVPAPGRGTENMGETQAYRALHRTEGPLFAQIKVPPTRFLLASRDATDL